MASILNLISVVPVDRAIPELGDDCMVFFPVLEV
jgi:hypothetical protein